jgi:enoyl-CoA hydratase/carnithine racemase
MGDNFQEAVQSIAADKDTRVVILTGSGKAFSAGGDLDFLESRTKDTPQNNAAIMRQFYAKFLCFRKDLKVPVISAINGAAVGAGMCLACATDIRLAVKDATMGVNFATLGMHPGFEFDG